jgi:hypothetical protein
MGGEKNRIMDTKPKGKPRGKPFVKGDERIHRTGRPRKIGIIEALEHRKGTYKYADGTIQEMDGGEILAKNFVNSALDSENPVIIRQALIMAKQEAREEALAQSHERELKERKLLAAAKKIEIENDIKKQRADLRMETEAAIAKIKILKAEQEEIKTRAMLGEYIDVNLMRYYFSFFQRGISDCFAAVKKISSDAGRLYKAGKPRAAEKVIITELGICFANAIKGLEEEIKNDRGKD